MTIPVGCSKWGNWKPCEDECTEKQRNKCSSARSASVEILANKIARLSSIYPSINAEALTPSQVNKKLHDYDNKVIIQNKLKLESEEEEEDV